MEIENLEAANKAVKRLKEVQTNLDAVIKESERSQRDGDNNPTLHLKIDGFALDIRDYPDLQEEIIDRLIARYSKEKQELIEQIKSF